MAPITKTLPGALRLRPATMAAARRMSPLRINATQRRTLARGPDDLGGPGGQEPPPQNPGGQEVLKRNWPMIGGGVLAVVALYAYLTSGGPKKGDLQKVARKGEEAVKDGVRRGEDGLKGNLREAEGSARNAGAELRGKKDGMGGFRAE